MHFVACPFLQVPLQVNFILPDSSALSSCHNRVYQSLANLIRWADQVMLDGIDLEDKENVASVTSVIKAVLDGVKVCLHSIGQVTLKDHMDKKKGIT